MRGLPAKIVGIGDLGRLLRVVRDTRQPERNRVIVLLSFKAGLDPVEKGWIDEGCRCSIRTRWRYAACCYCKLVCRD